MTNRKTLKCTIDNMLRDLFWEIRLYTWHPPCSGKGDLAMEPKSYTLILAAVASVLPKQSAQMNEDEESSPFTNVTQVDSEDE